MTLPACSGLHARLSLRRHGTEERFAGCGRTTPAVVNEAAPTPDLELLRGIIEGDSEALGKFYDRHGRTLFALTCRILNDAKEAEDVLQEVFLQIWEKAAAFDFAQGRPLAWALTLARHKAIDRRRALQRRRARLVAETESDTIEDFAAALPSPTETAGGHERGEIVRQALAGLPTAQRRAIELAFLEGLTQTEVAAALNEPLGTVKARIRRGMLKLRAQLEQRL